MILLTQKKYEIFSLFLTTLNEVCRKILKKKSAPRFHGNACFASRAYHFKPSQIRAHIAICYTAFALARHLEYRVSLTQTYLSFAKIRDELLSVQASILAHKRSNDRHRLPSALSVLATRIYRAVDAEPFIS